MMQKTLHACIWKANATLSVGSTSTPKEVQSSFGNRTLKPLACCTYILHVC